MKLLSDTEQKLSSRFEMKDLGESKMLLGIEIFRNHSKESVFTCQDRYVRRILERFGMSNANLATPAELNLDLQEDSKPSEMPYRESIGSPLYL